MKKLWLLCFLPLAAAAAVPQISDLQGKRIAFLGDSITQGGNREAGYINLIVNGLKANGVNIVKIPAGISGNKSNQMLARLEKSVLDKKPHIMLLSCGVNDVWHGRRGIKLPEYQQNITAIVEKTQAAGVKVCILTATMIREDAGNKFNRQLEAYNDFLRKIAGEKNCMLVDLNAAMQKQIARIKSATPFAGNALTIDGVHMNALGNIMMAENILRSFGMTDAQLRKAHAVWDKMQFRINDHLPITVREYKLLTEKANTAGLSAATYLLRLIRNDINNN